MLCAVRLNRLSNEEYAQSNHSRTWLCRRCWCCGLSRWPSPLPLSAPCALLRDPLPAARERPQRCVGQHRGGHVWRHRHMQQRLEWRSHTQLHHHGRLDGDFGQLRPYVAMLRCPPGRPARRGGRGRGAIRAELVIRRRWGGWRPSPRPLLGRPLDRSSAVPSTAPRPYRRALLPDARQLVLCVVAADGRRLPSPRHVHCWLRRLGVPPVPARRHQGHGNVVVHAYGAKRTAHRAQGTADCRDSRVVCAA